MQVLVIECKIQTMTKKNKKAKNNQILEFLHQVKVELGSVKWPSHQQTLKLTLTVIVISLIVGLYISGLDIFFTKLIQSIISR